MGLVANPLYPLSHCNYGDQRKFERHSVRVALAANHYCLQRPKVILEAAELVHALMKDGDNANIAIRKMAPINEMAFVPKEKTVHAKRCWYGLRDDAMSRNPIKSRK